MCVIEFGLKAFLQGLETFRNNIPEVMWATGTVVFSFFVEPTVKCSHPAHEALLSEVCDNLEV